MRACFGFVGTSRAICSLGAVAVMLSMMGCGGGAVEDKFKGERGTVSGKFTYKGAAVPAGCTVVFQSKEGGYSAGGTTNAQGEYTLKYEGGAKLPGVLYLVSISPPPVAPPKVDATSMKDGKPPELPPPALPAKYGAPTTSGLEFTVKGGENKAANFELKDE